MKHQMTALYFAARDPRVTWLPRVIVAVALAYALSPIDLIPDFIPVIGYLDDLVIVPALLGLAIKLIPEAVMADARARAKREPLSLRKNWVFACVFVAVWVGVVAGIALWLLKALRK